MIKFEAGTTYKCRSVCDHNCIWTYQVNRRTAKSVWLKELINANQHIESKRFLIKEYDGAEYVKPLGSYSMAPILRAG